MPEIQIIKPSVLLIEEPDLLKKIELAGRVCYKSEDRITEGSAEKFVRMLCKNRHTAMTEHGTVYLTCKQGIVSSPWHDILLSPYSHINVVDTEYEYITTNFRVIFEALNEDYDQTMSFIEHYALKRPTKDHELRHSFRIICDRGVSHELVRHRVFSFGQESTRYVAYGIKQPFFFIEPSWWEERMSYEPVPGQLTMEHQLFVRFCQTSADLYSQLLELGQTPQQARAIFPNAIKTEVVMTGTRSQWKEFLKLRTAPSAHPDMQIIANQIESYIPLRETTNSEGN